MRCSNWRVAVPVTVSDFSSKCGEPAANDASTQDVRGATHGGTSLLTGTPTTDERTRQRDSQSLPTVVTIVDEQVAKFKRKA